MKWSPGYLLTLLGLLLTGVATAVEEKAPPPVLPAVVYRDHLFTHYRKRAFPNRPYVIAVRPLKDWSTRITLEVPSLAPRNDFESLFARGRILVVGGNEYMPEPQGGLRSTDRVYYISPDRAFDAKWAAAEPTGEPVKWEIGQSPAMWGRVTPTTSVVPGGTEIMHTAVAAAGERDLLAFDLLRPVPAEGKPALPFKIAMTRIVPEERARVGDDFANWGKPEAKPAGEIPAAFTEPFQAYLIGDDYYFLTKSGSLYRSPPPAKGKPRTMSVIWDKAKRPPIRFIISDGNRPGVHFLITEGEKVGWKYFRLGGEPKPELLDTDPREGDSPAEVVYELARVLRDKKLIVTPK